MLPRATGDEIGDKATEIDARPGVRGRADGGPETLGRDLRAQVDNLDVGALPQHSDKVLADVVDVTLNRPDDRGVLELSERESGFPTPTVPRDLAQPTPEADTPAPGAT